MTARTQPIVCRAYRCGDQMMCPTCALMWDITDTAPNCNPKPVTLSIRPWPATFKRNTKRKLLRR